MALSRFVIGTTVTLPAGTATADANGFGLAGFSGPAGPPIQWGAGCPTTFIAGTAIVLDGGAPATPATGPQQLFAALTAAGANLRAYVQGQDDVGHAAISNLLEVISTVNSTCAVRPVVVCLLLGSSPAHLARRIVTVVIPPVERLPRRLRADLPLDVSDEDSYIVPGQVHTDTSSSPAGVVRIVRSVAPFHHGVVGVVQRVIAEPVLHDPGRGPRLGSLPSHAPAGLVLAAYQSRHSDRSLSAAVTDARGCAPSCGLAGRLAGMEAGLSHDEPTEPLPYFHDHTRPVTCSGPSHGHHSNAALAN